MKLKPRRPSARRARRFSKAFAVLGAVIGALPVTVRPGSRDRSKALRILIPASILGALAAGIAQRRRARASVETWESAEPGDPGHGADSGFDPTTGGSGNSTGTESAGTETGRRKGEVEGTDGSAEGATETPRAAGAETTTSAEAGSNEA